jgi:hypothetical protein
VTLVPFAPLERIGPAALATAAAKAKDGGMRPALAALAAALALLPATGAPATSIATASPHDTIRGCEAIQRVIADLNAGRLRDPRSPFPAFYSDAFGQVDAAEEAAFLHALRHSEGRPDRKPMRLYHVYWVHRDTHQPIYLVVLERQAWHETRLEIDDMLMVEEVPYPHYGVDTSYWLVKFQSNDIRSFREAPEMYPLMDDSTELKTCYQY